MTVTEYWILDFTRRKAMLSLKEKCKHFSRLFFLRASYYRKGAQNFPNPPPKTRKSPLRKPPAIISNKHDFALGALPPFRQLLFSNVGATVCVARDIWITLILRTDKVNRVLFWVRCLRRTLTMFLHSSQKSTTSKTYTSCCNTFY